MLGNTGRTGSLVSAGVVTAAIVLITNHRGIDAMRCAASGRITARSITAATELRQKTTCVTSGGSESFPIAAREDGLHGELIIGV